MGSGPSAGVHGPQVTHRKKPEVPGLDFRQMGNHSSLPSHRGWHVPGCPRHCSIRGTNSYSWGSQPCGRRQRVRKDCRVPSPEEDKLNRPSTLSLTLWDRDTQQFAAVTTGRKTIRIHCFLHPLDITVWVPKTGGETDAAQKAKRLHPKCAARWGRPEAPKVGLGALPQAQGHASLISE